MSRAVTYSNPHLFVRANGPAQIARPEKPLSGRGNHGSICVDGLLCRNVCRATSLASRRVSIEFTLVLVDGAAAFRSGPPGAFSQTQNGREAISQKIFEF